MDNCKHEVYDGGYCTECDMHFIEVITTLERENEDCRCKCGSKKFNDLDTCFKCATQGEFPPATEREGGQSE